MTVWQWLRDRCALRRAEPASGKDRPAASRPRADDAAGRLPADGATRDVVIYTRTGCHLCDEAAQLLQRYGLRPRMIDIDAAPELAARYTHCVPVVMIDGREHFRGRVNEVLLRRILRSP